MVGDFSITSESCALSPRKRLARWGSFVPLSQRIPSISPDAPSENSHSLAGRVGIVTSTTPERRDRQVSRVLLIEGSANVAVLGLKLVVGLATGSIGILGDAVHSVTDVANNAVAWFVVRLSTKPPDERHPYGHRKFETIAVFVLAMLLTVLAFELGMRAIQREAPEIVRTGWALGLMGCVLAVNVSLATWQANWARRLESDILRADARHTFADALTTVV
ncbi:MAG: cation diffusion facilitator family transporter, partial [Myxococcales bacterium]|nr:cation diffusion facilitator family transporter [Myxococcales bacterium]